MSIAVGSRFHAVRSTVFDSVNLFPRVCNYSSCDGAFFPVLFFVAPRATCVVIYVLVIIMFILLCCIFDAFSVCLVVKHKHERDVMCYTSRVVGDHRTSRPLGRHYPDALHLYLETGSMRSRDFDLAGACRVIRQCTIHAIARKLERNGGVFKGRLGESKRTENW